MIAATIDDKTGMVVGPTGGRDNLIKDTAVHLVLLGGGQRKPLPAHPHGGSWTQRVADFMRDCQAGPDTPGLWLREPGNPDRNSVDNLIGACVAGWATGLPIAGMTYQWGRGHGWCFNTEHASANFAYELCHDHLHDWFGRFPAFPSFVELMATGHVGLAHQIVINQATQLNAALGDRTDVGNRVLQWLMNVTSYGRGLLIDGGITLWQMKMAKLYPGGLAEMMGYYYGPDHEFTERARSLRWGPGLGG